MQNLPRRYNRDTVSCSALQLVEHELRSPITASRGGHCNPETTPDIASLRKSSEVSLPGLMEQGYVRVTGMDDSETEGAIQAFK